VDSSAGTSGNRLLLADCEVSSVFGRLYYHLDLLDGQDKDENGARKAFFMPIPRGDRDCVNFPLLEAVFAGPGNNAAATSGLLGSQPFPQASPRFS
jgi:hypothetical protein